MLLKSFRINGLFGTYSYEFSISESQNIFMLTGPNGYGKTTILTILNKISQKDLFYFYQLPFDTIEIELGSGYILHIVSTNVEDEEIFSNDIKSDSKLNLDKQVEFLWIHNGKENNRLVLNKRNIRKAARNIGYYNRLNLDFYNMMSEDFAYFVTHNPRIYDILAKEQGQEAVLMFLAGFSSTFIQSQRLLNQEIDENVNERDVRPSIDIVVDKLQNRIHSDYIKYLQYSQEKDSRFIDTLLTSDKVYSMDEYTNKVTSLEPLMNELRSFGLINVLKIREYDVRHAQILSAYIDDLENKCQFHSQTIAKLRLFSVLLEKKRFANKRIFFSPEFGLRVKSLKGEFLNVNKLSSGEQNEIIMLYNFIFEVPNNSLLLIDEPEISLHVAWQQNFIKDIESIAEMKNLQVVIATHSPQIISGRWDECFDLFEQNQYNHELDS